MALRGKFRQREREFLGGIVDTGGHGHVGRVKERHPWRIRYKTGAKMKERVATDGIDEIGAVNNVAKLDIREWNGKFLLDKAVRT